MKIIIPITAETKEEVKKITSALKNLKVTIGSPIEVPKSVVETKQKYVTQHEFDDEPTYIVPNGENGYNEEETHNFITLGEQIPAPERLVLAKIITEIINT